MRARPLKRLVVKSIFSQGLLCGLATRFLGSATDLTDVQIAEFSELMNKITGAGNDIKYATIVCFWCLFVFVLV